jgi:hypothetical protein
MPDEITMGELARRLDRFETRIDQQFVGVHRQIESLQFVSRDAFDALVARVDDLEEVSTWRYRLHAGGLVTLTIALIGVIMGLVVR